MSELLTTRDKARLAEVRAKLASGVNPYHKETDVSAALPNKFTRKSDEVRPIKIDRKFRNNYRITRNGLKRVPTRKTISSLQCLICGGPLEFITSVRGKLLVSLKEDSRLIKVNHKIVEEAYYKPIIKVGRAHSECSDKLDEVILEECVG